MSSSPSVAALFDEKQQPTVNLIAAIDRMFDEHSTKEQMNTEQGYLFLRRLNRDHQSERLKTSVEKRFRFWL